MSLLLSVEVEDNLMFPSLSIHFQRVYEMWSHLFFLDMEEQDGDRLPCQALAPRAFIIDLIQISSDASNK